MKHKKGGCLVSIIKFLFFFVLIICIIIGVVFGIIKYNSNKKYKELRKELYTDGLDIEKSLAKQNSDIDGYTKLDKYKMGLSTADNSDTDGDGLTDKDEIEIYHTDPLKISSSGDNLPDGYKVFKGLELNQKYDDNVYTDEIFNKIENIELINKTAENALLYVGETEYKLDGIEVEKAYEINHYDGKVKVDFSDFIGNDKNYVYFVLKEDKYDELKAKNGQVSFKTDGYDVIVGVIDTSKMNQIINSAINKENYQSDTGEYVLQGNKAIILVSPFMSLFTNEYVWIFEGTFLPKSGNRENEMSSLLSNAFGRDVKVTHNYVNMLEIDIIKNIFDYITNGEYFESVMKKDTNISPDELEESKSQFREIMQLCFTYRVYDAGIWEKFKPESEDDSNNVEQEEVEIKKEKPSRYISTFDVSKDTLPFANLCTYVSPGGNCAGFAEITTALFNNNLYEPSESMTIEEKLWSYDISNGDEFSTFFDKYLDDYKYKRYWKDVYGSSNISKLTDSGYKGNDKRFIEFLGYKWYEFNEKVESDVRFWNDYDNWSTIEALKDYFASGDKIASVAMYSGGSHAINAYGIEEDPNDPNICYILIYDNNLPNNKWGDITINNKIKVVKKKKSHWNGDVTYYYKYDYFPLPNHAKDYRYTNKLFTDKGSVLANVMQASGIVFFDENYQSIK